MQIVFEGEYFGNILGQIKDYVTWAERKDKLDKSEREVLMDVVSYVDYESTSDDSYYIVTTVENEAIACTCKGFHFHKRCKHIEGYNGSRT